MRAKQRAHVGGGGEGEEEEEEKKEKMEEGRAGRCKLLRTHRY